VVPTTVSSVLLFLALLGPGYLYVRRIETLEARYKTSAFRETVAIVISSLIFIGLSVAIFTVARISVPSGTPDVGALVRNPGQYVVQRYELLAAWVAGLFLLALLLAFVFSHPRLRGARVWRANVLIAARGRPVMDARSSWSRLFATDPGTIVRVACELDDGSWIDGWLFDWNAQPEEDGDRTITLHAPLRVRAKGTAKTVHLVGTSYSIVASSRIVRLDVTHIEERNREVFDAVYISSAGADAGEESADNDPG
jgi:hypothetical protein